ncbi:MAG: dTDP-4-dehydrorhamnose 3,5-epimerase [Sulfuricurvum sp. RIFCSPLOWO2_12_43_5]|nr:MAG: dTDP-4-dehydrorhamnose 3,5-epimerase [Sulfuricurvum sp. RIFCSPLOWO2_12_43_5]
MEIVSTSFPGLMIFKPRIFEDNRGKFIKTFNDTFFQEHGLDISIKETYHSISQKNVVRGMHFQLPPHDHIKLVYVPFGKIQDVVLDLRTSSPTFGQYFTTELSSDNGWVLIIPKGMAHGFVSREDHTNVTYMQTTEYAPDHDGGIQYDSFGFDWNVPQPKLSERDLGFVPFNQFKSPFRMGGNL